MNLKVGYSRLVLLACAGVLVTGLTLFLLPLPVVGQHPTATPAPPSHDAVFQAVWQAIRDGYYDPDFAGLDWDHARDRYAPLATAAPDRSALYQVLLDMLGELDASHLGLIPPQQDSLFALGFAEGEVGIDLRLLGDEMVITRVLPESPAAQAGLRPGMVVARVDGLTLSDIIEASQPWLVPPHTARSYRLQHTMHALLRTYGAPGTAITLTVLADQEETPVELIRTARQGKTQLVDDLPPVFLAFEATTLPEGTGYLRFNHFHMSLIDPIQVAVADMLDAPGLIIDLRGNPGGAGEVGMALAARLVGQEMLYFRVQTRDDDVPYYVTPEPPIYEGPVAVLIDELSASSSEDFAGVMQVIDRAVIVGQHTSGQTLMMAWQPLPDGGTLLYPAGSTPLSDGTQLEGRGVNPDIVVSLERDSLLQGVDSQLQAAVAALQTR